MGASDSDRIRSWPADSMPVCGLYAAAAAALPQGPAPAPALDQRSALVKRAELPRSRALVREFARDECRRRLGVELVPAKTARRRLSAKQLGGVSRRPRRHAALRRAIYLTSMPRFVAFVPSARPSEGRGASLAAGERGGGLAEPTVAPGCCASPSIGQL